MVESIEGIDRDSWGVGVTVVVIVCDDSGSGPVLYFTSLTSRDFTSKRIGIYHIFKCNKSLCLR